MGNRFDQERCERAYRCWPWLSAGRGRYWKRMLSKARRRYAKYIIRTGRHNREPTWIESIVNYKDY